MIFQTLSGPIKVSSESVADDVTQINSLANPPLIPLAESDVYVRRCRLAGDAIDGQYGCFRTHDLPRLLKLTQGAPALIGHNKFSLAVARFFGGAVETFNGNRYIVPKFYWPKQHSEAEDFRILLDAGIINEASIAFTFEKPTCSICSRDIRDCEHQPGSRYGLNKICHYFYDGVERVLEGSFVYRGAEPGTGIVAEKSDFLKTLKSHKKITVRYNGKEYQAMLPLEG
jgi:hypothetical protein